VIDADLWRFEEALVDAANAAERDGAVTGLERALAAYGGDFYPTGDSLWVEPVREDLHRRVLDACVRLAELYSADGRSDVAVSTLERAIELDPICEDAYRRLIELQARLGHSDAARRIWRRLQGRLADLDLEPDQATAAFVQEVLLIAGQTPIGLTTTSVANPAS
jgi:DNA-binding SARP family transcriptional activator